MCLKTAMRLTFQSTLPRRERRYRNPVSFSLGYFNPRSREGSDLFPNGKLFLASYFNPRSREGSDAGVAGYCPANSISIHAPAKGATGTHQKKYWLHRYFNPRSREGSDCSFSSCGYQTFYFNPRSREGSD